MTIKKKMLQAAAGFGVDVAGPIGVDFDGTNDYLSRSSDLVGNADGKTFTFSCWFYLDPAALNTNTYKIYDVGGGFFRISIANGNFVVQGTNGISQSVRFDSTSDVAFATWTHVLISVDLTNSSNRYVYMNDQTFSGGYVAYANQVIGFAKSTHKIGRSDSTAGEYWDGRLAGVYLDYTYRDLSVEANRRDFIDADGLYVTPPTTGIISVPMDDPDDVGRNDGTGGDFTLNGTVARSGRGPNQYNAVASTFDGTNDYLSLAGSGGDDTTYEATFSCTFSTNSLTTRQFLTFARDGSYDEGVTVYLDDDGTLKIQYYPSSGGGTGGVFHHDISSHPLSINRNYYLSISFDTRDSSKRHVFLDGVALAGTWSQYDSDLIDHDTDFLYIGSDNGTQRLNGVMGEVYKDNSYIDLATENPFYDVDTNKPKYLGESGELPTGSSPLIYLPLRADDAGNNLGTGGDFTVNSGPYVGARGASEFLARGAKFNGSNQYLRRYNVGSNALTGATDGKTFSVAVAFKHSTGTISADETLLGMTDGGTSSAAMRLQIGLTSSFDRIDIRGEDSTGEEVLRVFSATTNTLANTDWHILLFSVDMSDTGKRNLYLDGTSDYQSNKYTDNNIELSSESCVVGSVSTSFGFFNGTIGGLYYTQDYIDFSQEANRLKFVDAFGFLVDLQPAIDAADIPAPLVHMKFDTSSALGTNSGSGGDFTPINSPTAGADVKG
jgi:hypothetical protein